MSHVTFFHAAVVCALLLAGPAAHAAASPVNPKLAQAYEQLGADMGDDNLNLERARTTLASLAKLDADNALQHYAMARLHAWDEKWDEAQAEIEAGNKAPYAVHYQRVDSPDHFYPVNVTMRQLARAAAAAAPKLGPEKAIPLLRSFRALSRKVAWSEPRSHLSLLIGIALRSITQKALVTAYPAGSPEAAAEQKIVDDDRAYTERLKADASKVIGPEGDEWLRAAMVRQKLTQEQVIAYSKGAKTPGPVRTRILAMKKEWEAKERPWVARWLKQLPE